MWRVRGTDSKFESGKKTAADQSMINLLLELLRGDRSTHNIVFRFLAAFWGCLVLHLAIVVVGSARDQVLIGFIDLNIVGLYSLIAILVYSSVFATIVAFGIRTGSLVRHFVYGAALPTFAYLVGGLVSELLRGVEP